MKSSKIPINLIREHLFCPRIPYFNLVYELNIKKPFWTSLGNEHHSKLEKIIKRTSLSKFKIQINNPKFLFNTKLKHDDFDFYGIADCLILTYNNVIPVEFKLNSENTSLSHQMQLHAYGILAEKIFNKKYENGIIIYGKKEKVLVFKKETKTLKILKEIHHNIEKLIVPDSSASMNKCVQCGYLNFCNDRF